MRIRLVQSSLLLAAATTCAAAHLTAQIGLMPNEITAPSGVVMDRDTGQILWQKEAFTKRAMASTTKMMTALIAIERTQLPVWHPDYKSLMAYVDISNNAASQTGSTANLVTGEKMRLYRLLYCMLLPSGNDAAVATAEFIAGDESSFVDLMNARAAELGLSGTQFKNAAGRDATGHYSTAYDLARLARHVLADPFLAQIVKTPEITVLGKLFGVPYPHYLSNTNRFLHTDPYAGIVGVKTGTTENADACLVASATRAGKSVTTVVLGSTTSTNRYVDSRKLLDYGFDALFTRDKPTCLAVGDFDGNGYQDLAIGVPYADLRLKNEVGKVVVLMATAAGLDVMHPRIFTQDSPGISDVAEAYDHFGAALAVGDFDHNGRDDLAIGVPDEGLGIALSCGAAHVIYGDESGLNPLFKQQFFHQDSAGVHDYAEAHDHFGASLAVGRFDGNLHDDLAIGVPGEGSREIPNSGAVHVIYGQGAGLTTSLHPQFFVQGISDVPDSMEEGDRFGASLAAGNFDGSGHDDLAIGIPDEGITYLNNAGAVTVLYSANAGLDAKVHPQFLHQDSPGVPGNAEVGDLFAYALASGDFDGDGRDDLAVGCPGEDVGSITDAGYLQVFRGATGGLSTTLVQEYHQGSTGVPEANEVRDNFAAALAAGDFDSNGRDDLAIGIPGEDLVTVGIPRRIRRRFRGGLRRLRPEAFNVGAVVVIYAGNGSDGLNPTYGTNLLHQRTPSGLPPSFARPAEHFGAALAAGRFDTSLAQDLAIGVWGEFQSGMHR
ncbi:MAG: hypothetical protein ACYTKC_22005, partial [Planctomycetota bacterium]